MHLIYGNGRVDGMPRCPPRHPIGILKGPVDPPHDGRIGGRMFRPEPHRIGLERPDRPMLAQNLILIGRAFTQTGNECLPHPRRAAPPHRMAPPVPDVEIPHDRHTLRIRGPDGEMRALHALMRDDMRAQHLPKPLMRALAQKVFVHLAQHGAKAEGIVEFPHRPMPLGAQPIGRLPRQTRTEQPIAAGNSLGLLCLARLAGQNPQPFRAGNKGRDDPRPVPLMQAQHRKGIAMPPFDNGLRGPVIDQVSAHGRPPPKRRRPGPLQGRSDPPNLVHIAADRAIR